MAFMRDPIYVLLQDDRVLIGGPGDMGGTVELRLDTFDELVMMRYHQLNGREKDVITGRVLNFQYETGADAIRKYYGFDTVAERVKAELASEGIDIDIEESSD